MTYQQTVETTAAGTMTNIDKLRANLGVLTGSLTDAETEGTVANNFAQAGANLVAVGGTVAKIPNYLQGDPNGEPPPPSGDPQFSPQDFAAAVQDGGPQGGVDYLNQFSPFGDYQPGQESFAAVGGAIVTAGDFVGTLPGRDGSEAGQYGVAYAAETISEIVPAAAADLNDGLILAAESIAAVSATIQSFFPEGDGGEEPPGQGQDTELAMAIDEGSTMLFEAAEGAARTVGGEVPEEIRDGYFAVSDAILGDEPDSVRSTFENGRDEALGALPAPPTGGGEPPAAPGELPDLPAEPPVGFADVGGGLDLLVGSDPTPISGAAGYEDGAFAAQGAALDAMLFA